SELPSMVIRNSLDGNLPPIDGNRRKLLPSRANARVSYKTQNEETRRKRGLRNKENCKSLKKKVFLIIFANEQMLKIET
ncbi:MAG: hypothetical protein Q3994_07665, partial [Prevotella sp.]|nr:hypothetical protein [Prevotella sp.]